MCFIISQAYEEKLELGCSETAYRFPNLLICSALRVFRK